MWVKTNYQYGAAYTNTKNLSHVTVSSEESTNKVYMGQSSKQSLKQSLNGSATQTPNRFSFRKIYLKGKGLKIIDV